MIHRAEVLILSSRHDFSCDYVVARLEARGTCYLRLNSEDVQSYELCFDPANKELQCKIAGVSFVVCESTLRSIWFRRAVYLRDFGISVPANAACQIARSQWAALLRGLIVFDRVKWINHPVATYKAEQKPMQLCVAKELGFATPQTLITNYGKNAGRLDCDRVAIKGVDTVIGYENGSEVFAFTNLLPRAVAQDSDIAGFPVILQEAIEPKLDIRATVVGDKVFAVAIKKNGSEIEGDWRLNKNGLEYEVIGLPPSIERQCVELTRAFGLQFGAIDLAERAGEFYFLEINPTGEWAWLVDSANIPIDEAITDALTIL